MRYFTTPSVKQARKSVAWSLFFIFLLSHHLNACNLSKISLMDPNLPTGIIGKPISAVMSMIGCRHGELNKFSLLTLMVMEYFS